MAAKRAKGVNVRFLRFEDSLENASDDRFWAEKVNIL